MSDPIADILTFWFGDPAAEDTRYAARRKLWFAKAAELDQRIRDRFQPLYEQAAAGKLADWAATPAGALALLLLLDQFSRNMFRGTPQAFAADPLARQVAIAAIDRGFDRDCPPLQRAFFYLPLEHSEDLAHQRRSVELFTQLAADQPDLEDMLDYAIRHQRVIEQFGRFPHRNAILDRPSTPEEEAFLQQPGSSF